MEQINSRLNYNILPYIASVFKKAILIYLIFLNLYLNLRLNFSIPTPNRRPRRQIYCRTRYASFGLFFSVKTIIVDKNNGFEDYFCNLNGLATT